MTITAPQRLDIWPNGNPKPNQRPEVNAAHDRLKGADPRDLTVEDLASIGHTKRSLFNVIRQNCLECQVGNQAEVRRCAATGCPFWPYRMGASPFRSASRIEAGRRLALSRSQQPTQGDDCDDGEDAEG